MLRVGDKLLRIFKSFIGKFFNKGYQYFLTAYLLLNILWVFLGAVIWSCNKNFSYLNLSTSYIYLLVINLLVVMFLFIFKKINFDRIDIFLILLVIFGIISAIYANNFHCALHGVAHRYEGLYQLLYYYSLMFLATYIKDDKYKKLIIVFILFAGLFNSLFCFLQCFDIFDFITITRNWAGSGNGFTGNPNFLGSYMVLCLGLSIGMFINNEKKYGSIYLIFCMFIYSALLMSNTLSAIVGLFFICIIVLIYLIYDFLKKNLYIKYVLRCVCLFVSCLFISLFLIFSKKTVVFNDVINFKNETSIMIKGDFRDSLGSSRLFVWKNTLKIVPNYVLHGVGIDNFYYAFGDIPLNYTVNNKFIYYDKAHNEYLQKLICEGIFSCITYISMLSLIFFSSFFKIFKNRNYIYLSLLCAFVGYSIQAFFNISVIEVAPLFWIICGLLYKRKKFNKLEKIVNNN